MLAYPSPNVKWFKDLKPIKLNNNFVQEGQYNLKINHVSVHFIFKKNF